MFCFFNSIDFFEKEIFFSLGEKSRVTNTQTEAQSSPELKFTVKICKHIILVQF